jgi:hypothetical protein
VAGKVREVAKQRDQVCMSLEGFVRRPFQEQTIVSYYNCTNKDPTTSPPSVPERIIGAENHSRCRAERFLEYVF